MVAPVPVLPSATTGELVIVSDFIQDADGNPPATSTRGWLSTKHDKGLAFPPTQEIMP